MTFDEIREALASGDHSTSDLVDWLQMAMDRAEEAEKKLDEAFELAARICDDEAESWAEGGDSAEASAAKGCARRVRRLPAQ